MGKPLFRNKKGTVRGAEQLNSNNQLYKQAGNGVTVNVIKHIAERMEK